MKVAICILSKVYGIFWVAFLFSGTTVTSGAVTYYLTSYLDSGGYLVHLVVTTGLGLLFLVACWLFTFFGKGLLIKFVVFVAKNDRNVENNNQRSTRVVAVGTNGTTGTHAENSSSTTHIANQTSNRNTNTNNNNIVVVENYSEFSVDNSNQS